MHATQLRDRTGAPCPVTHAALTARTAVLVLPTLLLRLHWEAAEMEWREKAVAELRRELLPHEVGKSRRHEVDVLCY